MKQSLLILLFSCFFLSPVFASDHIKERTLRVGVAFAPPYIIGEKGNLSGVCIDLWRLISDTLNIVYEYKFYPSVNSLLSDVHAGAVDINICPLTATTARLEMLRFSIPFYISNMGIATRIEKQSPFVHLLRNMLSWTIIRTLLFIFAIVSIFAIILWLAERKVNGMQFRPGIKGVGDGIWWAFVTMTTVGYGDKIPRTGLGRVLAIFWMFFAIGLFFVASGAVSSELTVTRLQSQIKNPDDLARCKVGAIINTGYAETLARHKIRYTLFPSPWIGLTAVATGTIDAFVYDQAISQYMVDKYKLNDKIVIIPSGLNLQYFSFTTRHDNMELIDRINPALLNVIDGDSWKEILARYGINQ
jgi:ABC-type amino acid transport substrate-binding protein